MGLQNLLKRLGLIWTTVRAIIDTWNFLGRHCHVTAIRSVINYRVSPWTFDFRRVSMSSLCWPSWFYSGRSRFLTLPRNIQVRQTENTKLSLSGFDLTCCVMYDHFLSCVQARSVKHDFYKWINKQQTTSIELSTIGKHGYSGSCTIYTHGKILVYAVLLAYYHFLCSNFIWQN